MYIVTSGLNPNEKHIEHHGILGMKWGIRRYQNRDGSLTELGYQRFKSKFNDHGDIEYRKNAIKKAGVKIGDGDYDTIPKGTVIRRISSNKAENKSGSKYFYLTDNDRYAYRMAFYEGTLGKGDGITPNQGYEYEYKVKKDLKIAKLKTVDYYLCSKYGNERIKDLLDKSGDLQLAEGNDVDYDLKESLTKGEKALYNALNDELHNFRKRSMANNPSVSNHVKEEVVKELKAKGYDGMFDAEDVGYEYPLVVFDVDKDLNKPSVKET